jgi:hypothetical protein
MIKLINAMDPSQIVFGNPEVWKSAFKAHGDVISTIEELRTVATDLVAATSGSSEELIQVQNALTQLCSHSMYDVILLVGNMRGAGAMKIARGMFEISVVSTYLEQNPAEIHDYLNFAFIDAWHNIQKVEKYFPGRTPPDVLREAEAAFNRVKAQFSNTKGKVRARWSGKSIREMSEDIGLLNLYELAYGSASDLHHMPATGLVAHELEWSAEALYIAHGALIGTVTSLFNAHHENGTEFRDRLGKAIANFQHTRKNP